MGWYTWVPLPLGLKNLWGAPLIQNDGSDEEITILWWQNQWWYGWHRQVYCRSSYMGIENQWRYVICTIMDNYVCIHMLHIVHIAVQRMSPRCQDKTCISQNLQLCVSKQRIYIGNGFGIWKPVYPGFIWEDPTVLFPIGISRWICYRTLAWYMDTHGSIRLNETKNMYVYNLW